MQIATMSDLMRRKSLLYKRNGLLSPVLLVLTSLLVSCNAIHPILRLPRAISVGRWIHQRTLPSLLLGDDIRGGSTAVLEEGQGSDEEEDDDGMENEEAKKAADLLRTHRLTQHIYLQSRSIWLRRALIDRGLAELELSDTSSMNIARESDWDCALATEEHPKGCLVAIDADVGSKVIAPTNSTKWITISNLNRLRRNDPSKIDLLWHSQYKALQCWFGSDSKYSLLPYMPPAAVVFITGLLDRPWLLKTILSSVGLLAIAVTLPMWEVLVQGFLIQSFLWSRWADWYRFVRAGLPMKLFFIQLIYGFGSQWLGKVYDYIRGQMVEMECELLQQCIPLTIVEHDEDFDDR